MLSLFRCLCHHLATWLCTRFYKIKWVFFLVRRLYLYRWDLLHRLELSLPLLPSYWVLRYVWSLLFCWWWLFSFSFDVFLQIEKIRKFKTILEYPRSLVRSIPSNIKVINKIRKIFLVLRMQILKSITTCLSLDLVHLYPRLISFQLLYKLPLKWLNLSVSLIVFGWRFVELRRLSCITKHLSFISPFVSEIKSRLLC